MIILGNYEIKESKMYNNNKGYNNRATFVVGYLKNKKLDTAKMR